MKHIWKKLYVSLIAACMVFSSSFAVPVAAARGMSSDRLDSANFVRPILSDVESSQSGSTKNGVSRSEPSDAGLSNPAQSAAEESGTAALMSPAEEQAEFYESVRIDGVKISVRASEGAFPKGAALSVEKISQRTQLTVDEAIEKERAEGANVVASYSFDITVKDVDGNELQPADGHEVEGGGGS